MTAHTPGTHTPNASMMDTQYQDSGHVHGSGGGSGAMSGEQPLSFTFACHEIYAKSVGYLKNSEWCSQLLRVLHSLLPTLILHVDTIRENMVGTSVDCGSVEMVDDS